MANPLPASEGPPPPSSAASRALSIPELLEHILLHLSALTNPNIGHLQQYTPSYALFPLQRTNSTFLTTIQGSLKLKRRMFLAPIQPSTAESTYVLSEEASADSANLRPLWWLFEECERFGEQPRTAFGMVELPLRRRAGDVPRLPAKLDSCEASWRDMKVFRAAPGKPPMLNQGVYLGEDERSGEEMKYVAHVFLDEHKTLGEVWDCYYEIVGRGFEEHCGEFEHAMGCNACFGYRSLGFEYSEEVLGEGW